MSSVMDIKILDPASPEQLETLRIQNQSTNEWHQEYDAHFADAADYAPPKPRALTETKKDFFVFESFRTTRTGRLVISFINLSNGVVADSFFNVDTKKQRGEGDYEIGAKGQFFPQEKSKFRSFWLQAVKKEPRRWATAHKEMRARFKGLVFDGEVETGYRENNSPYNKLINLPA
jgi:hypothetical protein